MDDTLEKQPEVAHVRLHIPGEDHDLAHDIKRKEQVKKNENVTVISVYLRALKIGLKQLAKEAA